MSMHLRSPRRAPLFFAAAALVVSALSGCEDGLKGGDATVTRAFDGTWDFTFTSTVPFGVNSAPCLDGTGRVTVEEGRIVGSTFAGLAGVARSMGALEGRVLEDDSGVVMSVASSQGGRNAFVALGQRTPEGISGTWEDIHECQGAFMAKPVPDRGAGSS